MSRQELDAISATVDRLVRVSTTPELRQWAAALERDRRALGPEDDDGEKQYARGFIDGRLARIAAELQRRGEQP